MMAYYEMLARDRGRLADAARRMNQSPLGSGALAATTFAIDREATARALGFDRPTANSLGRGGGIATSPWSWWGRARCSWRICRG